MSRAKQLKTTTQSKKAAILDVDYTLINQMGEYNQALLMQLMSEGRTDVVLATSANFHTWQQSLRGRKSFDKVIARHVTRHEVKTHLESMGFTVKAVLVTASAYYERPGSNHAPGSYFTEVYEPLDKKTLTMSHEEQNQWGEGECKTSAAAERIRPEDDTIGVDSNKQHMFNHACTRVLSDYDDIKAYDDTRDVCSFHQTNPNGIVAKHGVTMVHVLQKDTDELVIDQTTVFQTQYQLLATSFQKEFADTYQGKKDRDVLSESRHYGMATNAGEQKSFKDIVWHAAGNNSVRGCFN